MRTTVVLVLMALCWSPALFARADNGGITVINDTEFTLDIRMDGQQQFTLKPGARKTIHDVAEGPHKLQALTSDGTVKFRKDMRVPAGRTVSWYLKWTQLRR